MVTQIRLAVLFHNYTLQNSTLWKLQCTHMLDKLLIRMSVCLPEISQIWTCCVLPSHGRVLLQMSKFAYYSLECEAQGPNVCLANFIMAISDMAQAPIRTFSFNRILDVMAHQMSKNITVIIIYNILLKKGMTLSNRVTPAQMLLVDIGMRLPNL